MNKQFRCEIVSWHRMYRLTLRLAIKIKQAGLKPDLIVAIARGGYVPARILCDFLNITNLTDMRVEHYGAGAQKKKHAALTVPINIDVRGKKVLIVDDVTETGDTLEIAENHIKGLGAETVRTAILIHKKQSPVVPDFYAKKIIKNRWIIYPWAVTEDLSELMAQMDNTPTTPAEAVHRIRQELGVNVPLKILQNIFSLNT
jgi:hypoxanthine phosphoribosyltransferase